MFSNLLPLRVGWNVSSPSGSIRDSVGLRWSQLPCGNQLIQLPCGTQQIPVALWDWSNCPVGLSWSRWTMGLSWSSCPMGLRWSSCPMGQSWSSCSMGLSWSSCPMGLSGSQSPYGTQLIQLSYGLSWSSCPMGLSWSRWPVGLNWSSCPMGNGSIRVAVLGLSWDQLQDQEQQNKGRASAADRLSWWRGNPAVLVLRSCVTEDRITRQRYWHRQGNYSAFCGLQHTHATNLLYYSYCCYNYYCYNYYCYH